MMVPEVAELATDSGKLLFVQAVPDTPGWYDAVQFGFQNGILSLTCDIDTDEVVAAVRPTANPAPSFTEALLSELVGLSIGSAWTLTNHRGYADAFQLRLVDSGRREATVQLEVAGSTIALEVFGVRDLADGRA